MWFFYRQVVCERERHGGKWWRKKAMEMVAEDGRGRMPLVVVGKREWGMGLRVGMGSHGGDHDNRAAGWGYKLRMSAMIDQLQIRNSLRMYNSPVERCFNDCVDTFRRKSLDKQETCVRRCAEKFLKHSMRVGMRFAELNQGAATPD
ncbi:Mitochondrial import inner membrane translocase subunit Tim9 like [Actinidia chinensis var. chinensis]|uniref:Mitochondrial import inner membrane translocase subunit n=1 Tax=Actinidia chinensis var. chinensis TaxID=1590841 RepID=A0A2R6RY88_ACTCC|nr:Mitochondrial import inner membrane translocase subunit Tim9 like [Actinidia chinensis var. chinensis]